MLQCVACIECIDENGVEGHKEAHMVVHFCNFMGRDHRRFNILPTKAVSEDQGSVLSVNLQWCMAKCVSRDRTWL